jgi:hypothetical protein
MLIRAALIVLATYVTGQWVAGVSVGVLLLVWALLATAEGPPVLALALTHQWMQVTIGVWYAWFTGIQLDAMYDTDWVTMVLIGLGCVTCLAIGCFLGIRIMQAKRPIEASATPFVFSAWFLYVAYGASLVLTGIVQELAWSFPSFTQAIIAITYSHLALLFLVLRRFTHPDFQLRNIAMVMAIEIALGFTGYFAGFREPLVMGVIAVFEVFNRRDVRHWALAAALAVVLAVSSLAWVSIRGQLRQEIDEELEVASRVERFERARTVSAGLLTTNASDYADTTTVLVDRMWAIHYPGMAIERVPLVLPHTDGQIMQDALLHLVTPRFLFPEKADLPSDSEMVRKYSGVNVAGTEQNTSIAFGYAAESYIDYGLPWMFVPVLVFGVLMGAAYHAWLSVIRHRELAIALTTVVFWLTLYLFERSWVKTLGLAVTLMVYLGGLAYLVDQWLQMRRAQSLATGIPDQLLDATH